MSLFALFSSFNLTVLLTVFTFTLDKLNCCLWKYFNLCLTITASLFTFTILPWLLYHFFWFDFHSDFHLIHFNSDALWLFCFHCHCEFLFHFYHSLWNLITLWSLSDFLLSFFVYKLFVEWRFFFELKSENLEQTILSTSIETVGPISYSDNNLKK